MRLMLHELNVRRTGRGKRQHGQVKYSDLFMGLGNQKNAESCLHITLKKILISCPDNITKQNKAKGDEQRRRGTKSVVGAASCELGPVGSTTTAAG